MILPISIHFWHPWIPLGVPGSPWVPPFRGSRGSLRTEYHKLSYLVPSLESSVSVVEPEASEKALSDMLRATF
jgi:hypothetical protein